jgi:hypothetical protein
MAVESRVTCDAPGCSASAPAVTLQEIGRGLVWVEVQVDDGSRVRTVHGCSPGHACAALAVLLGQAGKVSP